MQFFEMLFSEQGSEEICGSSLRVLPSGRIPFWSSYLRPSKSPFLEGLCVRVVSKVVQGF